MPPSAIVVFCLFFILPLPTLHATTDSSVNESFQETLDKLQKEYGFPGTTAAYVLRDGTSGVAVTGLADVEKGIPMRVQSRMLIASIGKTFVGATVLALANEGLLELDMPISHWLSNKEWFNHLPNHTTITIRHLLNHTSGLQDHVYMESFAQEISRRLNENSNPFLPHELIGFILDTPPLFEAGKGWSYSDTGYILLGLVIEAISGNSYYEEVKKRFLNPLALAYTSPSNQKRLSGLAAGYMDIKNPFGFPKKTIHTDGTMVWHPGFEWTGGGLISNSLDLAKWGSLLFGGNAIEGDYLEDLLQGTPIAPESDNISYGAGVGIYKTGPFGSVYGHGGWISGYTSSLRHYPKYGLTIAFQINTDIGIVGNKSTLISEMEKRLARTIISN